jgi:hypothetical protein
MPFKVFENDECFRFCSFGLPGQSDPPRLHNLRHMAALADALRANTTVKSMMCGMNVRLS